MKSKNIILVMIVALFLISSVSAFEFDNVKQFSKDVGDKYGTIEIKNAFGFGGTLASYKVTSNTDTCLTDCYAEGIAVINNPGELFENMRFVLRDGKEKQLNTNKIYTYTEVNEDKVTPVYSKVCETTFSKENQSNQEQCHYEKTSEKTEKITNEVPVEYNGEVLAAGTYHWRIEAKKNIHESIDWIGTVQGVELTDWLWWDASFATKTPINITNNLPNALINYSVQVIIPYDALMQNDYGDIRFVNSSENAELYSWNETQVGGSTATFWVFMPLLPPGNTTIFMYFNNPGAVDDFNISRAFIVGDHFDGSSLKANYWSDISSGGSAVVSGGKLKLTAASNAYGSIKSVLSFPVNYTTKMFGNFSALTSGMVKGFGYSAADGANPNLCGGASNANIFTESGTSFGVRNFASGTGSAIAAVTANTTQYDYYELIRNNTQSSYGIRQNGASSNFQTSQNNLNSEAMCLYSEDVSAANTLEVDWIFIRPIQYPEPKVSLGTSINNIGVTVAAVSPPSGFLSNISNFNISCNSTAAGLTQLSNVTVYINNNLGALVYTNKIDILGQVNLTSWITPLLLDGNYTWYCNTFGNDGTSALSTNKTFIVDTTIPSVVIVSPINNSNFLSNSLTAAVQFNASVFDNIGLSNCFYFNGTANNSIACGNNVSVALPGGVHTLIYYANDTVGNLVYNSTTFIVNFYNSSLEYQHTIVEGENNSLFLNITANNITSILANLSYNGTIYPMTLITSNDTFARFGITVAAPLVTSDTNINVFNAFALNNFIVNTPNQNQFVFNLPNLTVGSCSPAAITFNLVEEENLTNITGTFNYNFAYGLTSNTSLVRSFGQISSTSNFSLCINNSISNNFTLGDGMIFYNSPGYVDRRFYLFNGTILTNQTNYITLHDLLSASQTSFQLTIQASDLTPYVAKFTTLVRWYPNLNQYRVVDMGLTDGTGSTVIHVRTEDVDYRIGVYEQNGTLIKLADPIRMVCTSSPCTYTLNVAGADSDFSAFLNIQYNLDFNYTTGIWTFSYSDPSQKTQLMNLSVYQDIGTQSILICNSVVSGYVGATNCNVSGYTGTLRAVAQRVASPPVTIAQQIVDVITSPFTTSFGLWLSLLIAIPILFILSLYSPVGGILGAILCLIPALYLGSINIAIFGGIVVMGGIIAHFISQT